MISRKQALVATIVAVLSTAAVDAHAVYDMSGNWLLSPLGLRLDLTQSSGTIGSNDPARHVSGTIDEGTGEFHLRTWTNTFESLCGGDLIDGYLSADSTTFTSTRYDVEIVIVSRSNVYCTSDASEQLGSRCGNGDVDFGEGCDDSNLDDGDCCSSSCTFDPPATACEADDNVCTYDVCDGSGGCALSAYMAAGTPCDADASICTIDDACDGSGVCAAGAAMDCAPCGECDATNGCVYPTSLACDTAIATESLSIELGDDSRDPQLKLRIGDGVAPPALGNPTSSTDYTMCIYSYYDGVARPVIGAVVPAGGTCEGDDCWQAHGTGFIYADGSASAGGVSSMTVSEKGFRLRAEGANLLLPDQVPEHRLGARIVADDGISQACWFQWLNTRKREPTRYKGTFRR